MKALKDWTAAEMQEECKKNVDSCRGCQGCRLYDLDECTIFRDMATRDGCIMRPSFWSFKQLTKRETRICRAIGANWVTREMGEDRSVYLWDSKPTGKDGKYINHTAPAGAFIAVVSGGLFPSVRPGDCIEVTYD